MVLDAPYGGCEPVLVNVRNRRASRGGRSMRRILCVAALIAVVAIVAPASGDTEQNSCETQSAATASPLIADSAPVCTFEMTCSGATTVCVYAATLDVNGTGLVEGTLTAELVTPTGQTIGWRHADGSGEAENPSCSGFLQCHWGSGVDNNVLLFVGGVANEGAVLRVTCAGGGLSVFETVGCNLVAVEFGPTG